MNDFFRVLGRTLGIGALSLSLWWNPAGVPAAELPKVRVAYTAIAIQMVPFYLLTERTLGPKYGVDLETLYIAGASTATQAMIAGDIQFSTAGGIGVLNSAISGADIVAIANPVDTFIFKVFTAPDIRKPEDLKGKKVGISQSGSTTDFSARFLLKRWGLVPDRDVFLVSVRGVPPILAGMQSGVLQAGWLSEPTAALAKQQGFRELYDMSELGVPFAHLTVPVMRSYLVQHSREVRGFLQALLEAIRIFKTEKDTVERTIMKYAKSSNPRLLMTAYQEYATKYIPKVPYPRKEAFQVIVDQISNPKAKSLDLDRLVDNEPLREMEASGFAGRLYGESGPGK